MEIVGIPHILVSAFENGYKIYGIKVDKEHEHKIKLNKYGNITIVGFIPSLILDKPYEMTLKEKHHNKFGLQYEIENIKMKERQTKGKEFLEELLTKKQTKELLKHYPNIIDIVLNNDDVDLDLLYNIKEARFKVIKDKIINHYGLFNIYEQYGKYGLSFNVIQKLYNKYKDLETIEKQLKYNPYNSLCSIAGIAFKKADSILLSLPTKMLGINEELISSKFRMQSCITYVLNDILKEGNTRISIQNLKKECNKLVEDCLNHFDDCLNNKKYHLENGYIGLQYIYDEEQYIVNCITYLNKYSSFKIDSIMNEDIEDYRYIDDVKLTDEQLQTITMFKNNNVSILTSGAGCGKSLSSKIIVQMLLKHGVDFAVMCPTGKASKVIAEYTGVPAYTIHKSIGYNGEKARYTVDNPLSHDVIIIDEFSMADIHIIKMLFNAIDFNTKILIIADHYQLPSVGYGNVLHDLITSNIIPVNQLTKTFRFEEGGISTIATNMRFSKPYLKGTELGMYKFGTQKDYSFIGIQDEIMLKYLDKIYKSYIEKNSIDDIVVLTALNKYDLGTVAINKRLQKIFHENNNIANKKHIEFGQNKYYIGDRIMKKVNDYESKKIDYDELKLELEKKEKDDFYDVDIDKYYDEADICTITNGEMGTIVDIIDKIYLIIQIGDDYILTPKNNMSSFMLGYCVTYYKSQGISIKNVIMLTPKAHTYMLNSNLMYVGITRARKKVIHLGNPKTVNMCIHKKINFDRETWLKTQLNETLNKDFNQIQTEIQQYRETQKIQEA